MGWPDEMIPSPITNAAASELLTIMDGCPVSPGLRVWLSDLRGSARDAEGQDAMFGVGD